MAHLSNTVFRLRDHRVRKGPLGSENIVDVELIVFFGRWKTSKEGRGGLFEGVETCIETGGKRGGRCVGVENSVTTVGVDV